MSESSSSNGDRFKFERAIKANPNDAGQEYSSNQNTELPTDSISHGEAQVRGMVADRPAMGTLFDSRDVAWSCACRKFAGEDVGELLDWDAHPPHAGVYAENSFPSQGKRGAIRIRAEYLTGLQKGTQRSFEDFWADAVFELHNIANAGEFKALYGEARLGTLTKEQFVRRMFDLELRAMQQTRPFYIRVFLPWAKDNGFPSEPLHWFTTEWGSVDKILEQYKRSQYPWKPYGDYYEKLRLPVSDD